MTQSPKALVHSIPGEGEVSGGARKMPSAGAVRRHWTARLCRGRKPLADCPSDLKGQWFCFACGITTPSPPERCHINARCIGGSDHVSNIHLLCRTCHFASEMFSGRAYWKWFASWDQLKAAQIRMIVYGHALRNATGAA